MKLADVVIKLIDVYERVEKEKMTMENVGVIDSDDN
jgi:hypothetical protein